MSMVKKTIATKYNEFTASPTLPFYQNGCALLYNHMRSLRKVAPHGQLATHCFENILVFLEKVYA